MSQPVASSTSVHFDDGNALSASLGNFLQCHKCSTPRFYKGKRGLNIHIGKVHNHKPLSDTNPPLSQPATDTDSTEPFWKIISKLKRSVPLLKRIPRGARVSVSRILSFHLQQTIKENSQKSWENLLLLPFKILNVQKEKNKSLTTLIKQNCNNVKNISDIQHNFRKNKYNKNNLIESKLSDGDINGAARLLFSSDALAPDCPDTLSALLLKHPQANDNLRLPDPPIFSEPTLKVSIEQVSDVISSFRSGSAGGLDGLTPQHLKDLIFGNSSDSSQSLLKDLTALINLMLSGQIHESVTDILYGANLCALIKKDGSIRPIAVGTTYRRIAAKVCCKAINLTTYFQPTQLGFGSKGGCEAAVHALRTFLNRKQNQDLLERIFRLFDVERKDHLVQDDWIEFLKQRLREEKQIEFVEQLESIAYVLCGDGVISIDHFQLILQSRGITDKLFRLSDADGDGYVTADEVMEFLAAVSTSRSTSGFDKNSIEWLEQLFRQTVGEQKEIKREQFQKILLSKNPFFTERVFQIFDEDDSGTISLHEFIAAVQRFAGQSPEDKIRFLFKVYDLDGDGLIQHRELQHVLRACMEENGMKFSDPQLLELTAAMFEDADVECRGAITYEALRNQLAKHDGLLENLSISIDRWLVPPKPEAEPNSWRTRLAKYKPYQLSKPYFKNNYVLVAYLVVFTLVNVGLFVSRAVQYRESNGYVILARACGQCLNFTCAWLLVLMLRTSITWLRERGLGALLPLDHHIYLHKISGILVLVYSAIHTVMHLCNFSIQVVKDPVLNEKNFTTAEWLFTSRPGLFGLMPGVANPTGVALAVLLIVMVVCSQPFIRRGGSFEIFYWTHLLYIPFWVVLIFHGPNFWKWFVIPGLIYVVERIHRLAWMRSERGKTYISSGILLPSRVTHLVVRRPPQFEHRPGDYVYVNIPAIATYEWHPFTISSAPEQEDYIWLHIRGVGEWTNRLYEYFEKEQNRLQGSEVPPYNSHIPLGRSLSNKSDRSCKSKSGKKRSVDFSPLSYCNEAFTIEEENQQTVLPAEPAAAVKNGSQLLMPQHKALEKSLSMPDMTNTHNLKTSPTRSESTFSLSARRTRPAHPALARSFRYLRSKPTIIAFNTPSLDQPDTESIITQARRRLSKTLSPDKDEEPKTPTTQGDPTLVIEEGKPFRNPVGKPLEIYLEGPFGAPSSHIFRAQHAVLIAAGIGVTPFASILQSIMIRYWKARHTCPKCSHVWASDVPTGMRLTKVDFFWINREQRSFEWFVSLLSQLEMEQAELGAAMERFLDMHMYITSALQRTDMKAVGLQLALDLLHEKSKRDLITGLKTRTTAGRPNWDKVFQQLQQQRRGKVTVFYCGPPQLARVLRLKCDRFGFGFRKEVF